MEDTFIEKSPKKVLAATVGLVALAAIAVWQFYSFVVFKDANGLLDAQGGKLHLWLAAGLGLVVCVAGFFVISSFVRYDGGDEIHITSQGTP